MADTVYTPSPRRRSVFTGIVLIVIGALFLLHNIRGEFPVWDVFERWWPLIFILWGLAKLYDRVMANRAGQVAPATVTGGEIVLVFLLLVLVAAAAAVDHVRGNWNWDGDNFFIGEKEFTFAEDTPAQAVPANAQIYLRVDRGDVTVHGEDAKEIRLTTRRSAQGSSQEQAQDRANRVHMNITQSDSGYTIQPSDTPSGEQRVRTDVEIHVPKGASVSITTANGVVDVADIAGTLTVDDRGGDVSVRQAGGDVTVNESTAGRSHDVHVLGAAGNVRISGRVDQVEVTDVKGTASVDGSFFGTMRFERVAKGVRFLSQRTDLSVSELAGRLEVEGAGDMTISDVPGNVNLTTSRRDITLDNIAGSIHVENSKGTVRLQFAQAPKESVEVSNQTGDIEISLPSKASFDLEARSDRGEIESDFGDSSKISTVGNSASLSDSFGGHGPKLQLRTTYGTIRLRKGA